MSVGSLCCSRHRSSVLFDRKRPWKEIWIVLQHLYAWLHILCVLRLFSQTPSSLYALGNITAFCLLNVMDSVFSPLRLAIEIEYQYQHHWLAGTLLLALCCSLLYPSLPSFRTLLVSCFIGDFILFFLPKPVRVDASQHIKQKSTKRMSVWSRVKYIWHIMTKSNIKYLLFVFINVGIVHFLFYLMRRLWCCYYFWTNYSSYS